MSNLTDKTDYDALLVIARMVKEFEQLHLLGMTRLDDGDATKARNLLEGIVQSNGYRINYDSRNNKPLLNE